MMLSKLTRKFCPLVSLAMLTLGCGKEIIDAETQSGSSRTDNQNISPTYILTLNESQAVSTKFIPEDTNFKIPDRLHVISGSATGKQVFVTYDVDEYDDEMFQFRCSYYGSENSMEMNLANCVNDYGGDFGDISQHVFSLYKNNRIDISIQGPLPSNLSVKAIHTMNWIIPQ